MTLPKFMMMALCLLMLAVVGPFGPRTLGQNTDKASPWGEPVDGMVCRLVIQPHYRVGQAIKTRIEVKNTSDKKRFFVPRLDPQQNEHLILDISGPGGKVRQTRLTSGYSWLGETAFKSIDPGEVMSFDVNDLRDYFESLNDWQCFPVRKANAVPTGKYTLKFRFVSPKVPDRFLASMTFVNGKQVMNYKDVPAEVTAGQWANQITSAPVAFELLPLGKDDLVVHEWGVFTVFNDAKYANANRQEEWGSLPNFFYRQFPQERLRWVPSAWDKPIVYFYTKASPMRVNVKVTFAEGAPVVWWPAASDPVESRPSPVGKDPARTKPFRSLTWEAWLGNEVPPFRGQGPLVKAEDFPLPADCWLQHARLPDAAKVTVVGNIEGPPKVRFPGSKDRIETERFLYYDGLVPTPDYLRCEKVDGKSVTLSNRARFDLTQLFVVDRRDKQTIGFAFIDGKKQSIKAGTSLKIELKSIVAEDWPFVGLKSVRQALLDAGLFEAEADSLLKIWSKQLLEANGVTAFHILPGSEYDRMLPLDILPAPPSRPVRVGIALHPHIEIEPGLAERVAILIRQLNSDQFEQRVAANNALLEIGPMAIKILRDELKPGLTVELRRRIESILDRVDGANWLELPTAKKNK